MGYNSENLFWCQKISTYDDEYLHIQKNESTLYFQNVFHLP